MKVYLKQIEQLDNGDARVMFYMEACVESLTRFSSNKLMIRIPRPFAENVCVYIIQNSFNYGTELHLNFLKIMGKESIELTSRSNVGSFETKLQITDYYMENL
jgi:hypothetical protein